MRIRSRVDLAAFIADLPVPAKRREVLLAELEDHAFSELAELESVGVPAPEAEERAFASLGDPGHLRLRLIESERRFELGTTEAFARALGIASGPLISLICALAFVESVPAQGSALLLVVAFSAPAFSAAFWPGIACWPSLRSSSYMHHWGGTPAGRRFLAAAVVLSVAPAFALEAYLRLEPWGHLFPALTVAYSAGAMSIVMIASLSLLEWATNVPAVVNRAQPR